jgi:hypothetical protein
MVIPRAFSSGAASIWSYDFTSPPYFLRQHHGHRRRQRRLAVIDVPDRPHVHVRLRPIKFALGHFCLQSDQVFLLMTASATFLGASV